MKTYKRFEQTSPYDSPWSLQHRLRQILWEYCWMLLCNWTPKPFNRWRIWILKLFGAKIIGQPFVHQRARIQIPWHLTLGHRAAIGDRANLYSLGKIYIGAGATVAQEAYLCTGTHDFSSPTLNLMTASITVGERAFIGARAFILPGVHVGEGAVVGACSIVTKNILPNMIVKGQPIK